MLAAKRPQDPVATADGEVEVSRRYFSLGKLVRKCVKKVASTVKKTMDLVEQGLLQVARLFVGSRTVEVEIVLKNTDVDFTPASGPTDMVQPWGGSTVGFGENLKLKGVSVRAAKAVFLSKGTLGDNNKATVRVLNHVGADICFTASNDAAELMSGWFIPHEVCNFIPPNGGEYHIGDDGKTTYSLPVQHNFINVLAQLTNARKYMKDVASVDIAKTEVITGAVAQIIGNQNNNRAFAPCLALNGGALSVYDLAAAAGEVTGQMSGSWVMSELSSKVRMDTGAAGKASSRLQSALDSMVAVLAELAAQFPGHDVTTRANTANDATRDAKTATDTFLRDMQALDRAQQAAYKAKQAADAAVGRSDESTKKAAATTAAQEVQTAASTAKGTGSTALARITDAWNRFGELYSAMNNVSVSQAVRDGVGAAYQSVSDAKQAVAGANDDVDKVIAKAAEVATGVAAGVAFFIGAATIGEVFELFASGDIILPEAVPLRCTPNPNPPTRSVCRDGNNTIPTCPAPSGQCYQSGDRAGFPTGLQTSDPDPKYRNSVMGRGVATHEYGHYVLCNLLEQAWGDEVLRSAYGEAAMVAVLSPDDVGIQSLYINDGFADFFASEVVGGTSYPELPASKPEDPKGGLTYCADLTFASDMTWTSSTNGWGPAERNQSNGGTGSGDGNTITLDGTTYNKGIGVHAPSEIVIPLNGAATHFRADIGVDDEVGSDGSVTFEVWADATRLYVSPTMTGTTARAPVDVTITSAAQLRLVVTDAGDGNGSDHADWANAHISFGNGCVEDNVGAPGSTYPYNPASPSYGDEVARLVTTFHDVFDRYMTPVVPGQPSVPAEVTSWSYIPNGDKLVFSPAYQGSQDDEAIALPGWAWSTIVKNMISSPANAHMTQNDLMKGINQTMKDANDDYNWCMRCEVFRRHTPSATCPAEWMDPRPTGMVCEWEDCVAPNEIYHQIRLCGPHCPDGQYFSPVTLTCMLPPQPA